MIGNNYLCRVGRLESKLLLIRNILLIFTLKYRLGIVMLKITRHFEFYKKQ